MKTLWYFIFVEKKFCTYMKIQTKLQLMSANVCNNLITKKNYFINGMF